PSGVGKTLSSLHFVYEGARNGDDCLFVSFEETEDQLLSMGASFGWEIDQYREELSFLCRPPSTGYPEQHFARIRELVEEQDVDRLVVDSLTAFRSSSLCGRKGVTAFMTASSQSEIGAGEIMGSTLSTVMDNILVLNSFEAQGEIRYSLGVLKTRNTEHDQSIRSYTIGTDGISIGTKMQAFEGVMSGDARKVGKTVKEKLRSDFTEFLGPMGEQEFEQMVDKGISRENVKDYIESLVERNVLKQEKAEKFRERSLSRVQE
ncbi:MAG: ATPase domain-containing protein, partial [Candidatus Nanohaloarchaea archaeon]|nr:ATPase domain-containing protein [Candidatus Nanohaloarchaea archaeon]